jgi:hypothetical protein
MASVGIGNNSRYDASLNLDYHQNKWTFNVLYNLNATKIRSLDMWTEPQLIVVS